MKCTECGTKVRPVVAVDIDGTLGMYHEHFTEFASEYVGSQLHAGFPGGVEFSEYLGMEKQSYREAKLAYRQGGMKRTMPMYSGARSFMMDLNRLDVEVWIATTRPWMRLDNIDPDTREWLSRNSIRYDYMIYGDNKYDVLIDRVGIERVVMVIDDLSIECGNATNVLKVDVDSDPRLWPVIQPRRTHNQNDPFPHQFTDFSTLLGKHIYTRVEEWYAENTHD